MPAIPTLPTNSAEWVNSLSHYYRGELSRMMSWRDRLDRTTNWSIAATAGMLSVSLSTPTAHHGVLLFAMLLVFLLLVIEARRYRFFHVYRSRIRLLERNYYAPMFSGSELIDPTQWMTLLSEDLRAPRFTLNSYQAMARRLRRTYCWIFLILLFAWLLKTTTVIVQSGKNPAQFVHSWNELLQNAGMGGIPGWTVLIVLILFYGWMFYIMLRHRETPGELGYGNVHV
jgi:uncharacterized membrane protein